MVINRLDENPIIVEGFSVPSISFGDMELETLQNEQSVFVQPTLAGENTVSVKYNNMALKVTISAPNNSSEFEQLSAAVFNYVITSSNNRSATKLKVSFKVPSFNIKVSCQDAVWERPTLTGSILDPESKQSLVLILPNATLEKIQ